jgi:hypothetical protein
VAHHLTGARAWLCAGGEVHHTFTPVTRRILVGKIRVIHARALLHPHRSLMTLSVFPLPSTRTYFERNPLFEQVRARAHWRSLSLSLSTAAHPAVDSPATDSPLRQGGVSYPQVLTGLAAGVHYVVHIHGMMNQNAHMRLDVDKCARFALTPSPGWAREPSD